MVILDELGPDNRESQWASNSRFVEQLAEKVLLSLARQTSSLPPASRPHPKYTY